MKKLTALLLCLSLIAAPAVYAETFSTDYEFEMIAFDKNSPDERILAGNGDIELGVIIRNNSTTLPLEFTSLDFWLDGIDRLDGEPLDISGTVVGQLQNFRISPRGRKIAVCSTLHTEPFEPGRYILYGHLRNSVPAPTQSGVSFGEEIDLDVIITVADVDAERDVLDKILASLKKIKKAVHKIYSLLRLSHRKSLPNKLR